MSIFVLLLLISLIELYGMYFVYDCLSLQKKALFHKRTFFPSKRGSATYTISSVENVLMTFNVLIGTDVKYKQVVYFWHFFSRKSMNLFGNFKYSITERSRMR